MAQSIKTNMVTRWGASLVRPRRGARASQAVESGCIVHVVVVQVTEDSRIGGQYGDAGHLRGARAQSSA